MVGSIPVSACVHVGPWGQGDGGVDAAGKRDEQQPHEEAQKRPRRTSANPANSIVSEAGMLWSS